MLVRDQVLSGWRAPGPSLPAGRCPRPARRAAPACAGSTWVKHAHDVGDVAREGREGLLDRLLVADVGVDVLEHAHLRAGLGRDMQPGLGHQGQQPTVLSVTVLPPVFGPVMTTAKVSSIQVDVDRHDPLRARAAGGAPGTGARCCRGGCSRCSVRGAPASGSTARSVFGVLGARQRPGQISAMASKMA